MVNPRPRQPRSASRVVTPAGAFGARRRLAGGGPSYYAVDAIADLLAMPGRLPVTLRILLENALRHAGRGIVTERHVEALAAWRPGLPPVPAEIPFLPSRVLLQDFTGVPLVVDLASLRDAVAEAGGDPASVRPHVPVDLVIDHSIQVDVAGASDALAVNMDREYARNRERYALLRWAQQAFEGLRVVPPGRGIVHQVNLEYLAEVVRVEDDQTGPVATPDTVVGTDSHTTMVNALGVLGFGVGGIEAEAVLLGFGLPSPQPRVVGVRLVGRLPRWSTATDLALRVTEALRAVGVVGSFVEFTGDGIAGLTLPDRATVSNMAPEYGATAALFPVDAETLAYLTMTGRSAEHVALVERYAKAQRLWRDAEPVFDELVELDLGGVEPSMAGPRRPQDRVPLGDVPRSFAAAFPDRNLAPSARPASGLFDGSVVIAAITSCTNTSNAALMITAGLLARNAVARGVRPARWVKTSLAPGSRVVTDYLARLGLQAPLDALGFAVVGYGCTTCIGNSGPLDDTIASAITTDDLVTVAVLSGNRNFDGRIHPLVRAAYLASPPLVVAYALAGRIDIDLTSDPLGIDRDGRPVHLGDLWPSPEDVAAGLGVAADPAIYASSYRDVFEGDARWQALPTASGDRFVWDPDSTYVARAPFPELAPRSMAGERRVADIIGARVLVHLGDSVTTDHSSPAGSIALDGPAGRWLVGRGVSALDFNSYGARRGHHELMARGTFGNVRLRDLLVPGREGPITAHQPLGEVMPIFDAAMRYGAEGVPLVVLAGREYGTGSSRDWAAKGPRLLGVRAVLAESFERIHRANLVGMGILPLRLPESPASLGLDGTERYDVRGIESALATGGRVLVRATAATGRVVEFTAEPLLNGASDEAVYRAGGILPAILARLLEASSGSDARPSQPSAASSASSSSGVSTSGLAPSTST